MSPAAKSVYVFSIYLSALGTALMAIPDLLLALLGIPATDEVWIRTSCMLILLFPFIITGSRGAKPLIFPDSVYLRASVIIFPIVFVVAGYVKSTIILSGVIDLAGAFWTWSALKRG